MTAQTWVSVVLAVIALAALYFTALSAMNAARQTRAQEQIRRDAAQPYVWADLRPDDAQGGLMLLVVGNSGPTVATDVRVRFDPEIEDRATGRAVSTADRLKRGISSLAPGRVMTWHLGAAFEHFSDVVANHYVVTIDARGPFGSVASVSYSIDLEDMRGTKAPRQGSMHLIAKSINDAAETLASALDSALESARPQEIPPGSVSRGQ